MLRRNHPNPKERATLPTARHVFEQEKVVPGSYSAADDAVLVETPIFEEAPGVVARVTIALNGVDYTPSAKEVTYDVPKGGKGKKTK